MSLKAVSWIIIASRRRGYLTQLNGEVQHDTNDIDDRTDECSDKFGTSFSPVAFESFGAGSGGIRSRLVICWEAWRHGSDLCLVQLGGDWGSGLLRIAPGTAILTRPFGGLGGCLCLRRVGWRLLSLISVICPYHRKRGIDSYQRLVR